MALMNLIRCNKRAMKQQRKSRFYPVEQFYSDLDKMLNQLWNDFDLPSFFEQKKECGFSPAVNVSEDDNGINVSVELPGMAQKEIQVKLKNDILTIEGEKGEPKEEQQNVYQMERRFGKFQRSICLPSEVEEDQVDASFNKGVLNIRLPKSAKSQTRMIEVKAS